MSEKRAVSVIVPVFRDSEVFREALHSIAASDHPAFEILLVDDSIDGIEFGDLPGAVRVIRTRGAVGPARARNIGAGESAHDILVFIDSDVVIMRDTLSSLVETMEREGASGVIAVQSPRMRCGNFSSAYKNIFMCYSYRRLEGGVPLFYTCCAMVKRGVFLSAGGFDEGYACPATEDTDMGNKLAAAGAKVVVGRNIEVEHVKGYTLTELIELDFRRAAGLVRLLLRRRSGSLRSSPLSVPTAFIASGSLSVGMLVLFILFIFRPTSYYAALLLACYAGLLLCNAGLIGTMRRYCGTRHAVQTALFLPIELFTSVAGSFWGMITFFLGRRY